MSLPSEIILQLESYRDTIDDFCQSIYSVMPGPTNLLYSLHLTTHDGKNVYVIHSFMPARPHLCWEIAVWLQDNYNYSSVYLKAKKYFKNLKREK